MNAAVVVCADAARLAIRAAEWIIDAAAEAMRQRGRFCIALAGGSTPENAYARLAESSRRAALDWSRTFVCFGDERCVPFDDPRSNFGMARRALLDHVPVPPEQVFPIPVDRHAPAEAAAAYARTLAAVFGVPTDGAPPRFDLILLGLGDDGHTASLFPRAASLAEDRAWAVASPPGILPPPVERVTLTFPVLNAGRNVVFLVSGEKKAEVLRDVLEGHPDPHDRPAAGVHPFDGTLTWLLDVPAARRLQSAPPA